MLHYDTNRDVCEDETLLLMDLGAKFQGYCADITRTYPVNGKYTERQRQVYDVVLAANRAVAKAAKPGMTLRELDDIAKDVLGEGCVKLGLIEKPLKIMYSYPAIVIGMIYVLLPFMILSVYSSAEKLDWSLVEAARDLGASKAKAFWTVSFKLTLPGLLSGVILTFIPSMGLFFIADILGGNKVVLVGSLIQDQMTRGNNWPFAAALAVIMMILTTLMILLYRKVTNAKEVEGLG